MYIKAKDKKNEKFVLMKKTKHTKYYVYYKKRGEMYEI